MPTYLERVNPSTKRALIAAAVIAIACGFFSAPDVTTQVAAAAFLFVLIFLMLMTCVRFLSVAKWPSARQWAFMWLMAAGLGAVSMLLPILMKLLFGGR